MALAHSDDDDRDDRVTFREERDGSVTAVDSETGLARGGDTRAEALAQLAEVLTLEEGGGEPLDRETLAAELGVDVDDFDDEVLPEFLRD